MSLIGYRTIYGEVIPLCGTVEWTSANDLTLTQDQAPITQVAENAAFAWAMVVRNALGLNCSGGQVTALVRQNLFGLITLATARQLLNSGGQLTVVAEYSPRGPLNDVFRGYFAAATRRGAVVETHPEFQSWCDASRHYLDAHLILFAPDAPCELPTAGRYSRLCERLNDAQTPVHTIGWPAGIDPDTGHISGDALYASSTLSLGAALRGLVMAPDHVGRHYLADAQWDRGIYASLGYNGEPLFREQPIIRLNEFSLRRDQRDPADGSV
jgi:NAD(P)H-hydrate repair Nnr-like enzyme with NAD(P)H-hydrate epimerase domain